jgi:hypothetical protein
MAVGTHLQADLLEAVFNQSRRSLVSGSAWNPRGECSQGCNIATQTRADIGILS